MMMMMMMMMVHRLVLLFSIVWSFNSNSKVLSLDLLGLPDGNSNDNNNGQDTSSVQATFECTLYESYEEVIFDEKSGGFVKLASIDEGVGVAGINLVTNIDGNQTTSTATTTTSTTSTTTTTNVKPTSPSVAGFNELAFQTKSSPILVKECWCAHILGRKRQYCLAQFNTCQVQGNSGPITCFSNDRKFNVARGVWPFCMFCFASLIYLWMASEYGRRARGFVRRQTNNGINHLLFSKFHRNNNNNGQSSRTTNSEQQQQQQQQEGGTETSGNQENVEADVERDVILYNSRGAPTQVRFTLNLPAADEDSNNTNAADRENVDSNLPPSSQPATSTATDNTNNPSGTTTTPSTSATVTPQQRGTLYAITTNNYPPELGSRSNYIQLVHELYHIRRYEPERMMRLWHSAWRRENRHRRRQMLMAAAAAGGDTNNNPSAAVAAATAANLQNPFSFHTWWYPPNHMNNRRRTVKLELKTKRFESTCNNNGGDGDRSTTVIISTSNSRETDEGGDEEQVGDLEQGGMIMINCDHQQVDDHEARNFNGGENDHDAYNDNDDDGFEACCAICLVELEDGDIVGDIPCQHIFHKDCLKSWLLRNNRCPLCQYEGIALETPCLPVAATEE